MDDLHEQVTSVGALAEPVRHELYRFVADQQEPVSREQAAAALDRPLHSVKFHLDRLVEAGLLEVEFRRLTGRTGPGAGRPSKLYRRSSRVLSVSLPERRYDVAGEVLAEAVERSLRTGEPVDEVLADVAREIGRVLGAAAADEATSPPEDQRLSATADVLSGCGYEPLLAEDEVCLSNCPFDRLATKHTELVCGMNRHLVEGVLDGAGIDGLEARLAPAEGFCCVRVGP